MIIHVMIVKLLLSDFTTWVGGFTLVLPISKLCLVSSRLGEDLFRQFVCGRTGLRRAKQANCMNTAYIRLQCKWRGPLHLEYHSAYTLYSTNKLHTETYPPIPLRTSSHTGYGRWITSIQLLTMILTVHSLH